MQKFQFLLFVLKQSYICYYIIYMTVPLNKVIVLVKSVLTDLHACNFVHAKNLFTCTLYACSSPCMQFVKSYKTQHLFQKHFKRIVFPISSLTGGILTKLTVWEPWQDSEDANSEEGCSISFRYNVTDNIISFLFYHCWMLPLKHFS